MGTTALALDEFDVTAEQASKPPKRASQFVSCNVGENAYGVDIMAVREIRSWSSTTSLPDQAFSARGVLDIRGSIVEVFDLSAILGTGSRQSQSSQVVLVVAIGNRNVGLAVDGVSDIVDAEPGDFAEPPLKGGKVAAIVRQQDHLISILDLDVLFR